jgi:hypothetical protein
MMTVVVIMQMVTHFFSFCSSLLSLLFFCLFEQSHLVAQHPVVMGVFLQESKGDPDYDHIVVATGFDV